MLEESTEVGGAGSMAGNKSLRVSTGPEWGADVMRLEWVGCGDGRASEGSW